MSDILFCRICLNDDRLLFNIINTRYGDLYEKLTGIPLQSPNKSHRACYMCHYLLKKCILLKETALKADQIFNDFLDSTEKNPGNKLPSVPLNLSILNYVAVDIPSLVVDTPSLAVDTPSMTVDIPAVAASVKCEIEVKLETEACDKDSVKDVYEEDNYLPKLSDSEDDVPLNKIAKREPKAGDEDNGDGRKSDDDVKHDKNKVTRNGSGLSNSTIITLSREQQLQELVDRSTSVNYLNSRYKCQLCYKGFSDARTFDNHARRHDPRSGTHECDVCHMRYKTSKKHRMHTYTCHVRQFRCDTCSHKSHTMQQAREHEAWHSGHTFTCQPCGLKFNKSTSYLSHVRARHASRYSCDMCGHTFAGKRGLQLHLLKTHRGEPPAADSASSAPSARFCDSCQIQFHTTDAFKRHLLTNAKHTADIENSPQCLICGEQVPRSLRMKHIRQHSRTNETSENDCKDLMLSCMQCPERFPTKSKLNNHIMRKHKKLKRYNKRLVCEVCGKECTSNATLQYHQRTHTGEKPYSCEVCSKRFVDKNQLRIHSRTHTGERPYRCATCLRTFTQKPALNRHLAVHTGIKAYPCQLCTKSFTQSNSLKLHVNTAHLNIHTHRNKKKELTVKSSITLDAAVS